MRRSTLILSGLVLFVIGVGVVHAQDISAYRKELDLYRTQEEQFLIASQQYANLKTLTAQDDAVKAARTVMLTRVDTVLTYIQTLRNTLDTQQGVELTRKSTLESQLDLLVETLNRHRSRVDIATDRVAIAAEMDFFEGLQPQVLGLSNEGLALLKIGTVQAAVDQLDAVHSKINTYIDGLSISETARSEKKRGSDEITRTSDSIKTVITSALSTYDQDTSSISTAANSGGQVQTILAPAYSSLTQSVEYVKELTQ